MLSSDEALGLLESFAAAGVEVWVDGGWGVDALLGRQSRQHGDLDVVLADGDLHVAHSVLTAAGFGVFRDLLPTALALRHPDGREVDLHPVRRTADGGGDQVLAPPDPPFHYAPPTTGSIAGVPVRCVDAGTQLRAHTGYPPRAVDVADMRALSTHTGLPLELEDRT